MNVVIIGYGGHYGSAVTACAQDKSLSLCGVAPGFSGESCQGVVDACRNAGLNPAVYADWRQMVRETAPDIAVVCPRYDLTASISLELLRQGIHVFSEKPIALSFEDLDALKACVQKGPAQFSAMHTYYYDPNFVLAKSLLDQGAIGEIRLIAAQKSYRFGNGRPDFYRDLKTYGGTIPWVGVHALSWVHWFTGRPFMQIYAQGSTLANRGYGQLDMTNTITGKLTDEILVNIGVDYLNTPAFPVHGDDRIRLAGSQGTLEILKGEVHLYNAQGARIFPARKAEENIFAAFVSQIQGGPAMRLTAQDCFEIARMTLLAQQSRMEERILYVR